MKQIELFFKASGCLESIYRTVYCFLRKKTWRAYIGKIYSSLSMIVLPNIFIMPFKVHCYFPHSVERMKSPLLEFIPSLPFVCHM
jgi:hypothetical protein